METDKALQPDSDSVIPRIKLSESGTTGLAVSNKKIYEEANRLFQYPQFVKVVNEMRNDATVAANLLAYKTLIGRVDWSVKYPVGATEAQIKRADFIASCMKDMEHSWSSFITEVTSYLEYGFAIHVKVFKRRLKVNGSRFNDGLVGWKKLAPRSQSTISDWKFSDDGRDLEAIEQDLRNINSTAKFILADAGTSKVTIPRKKFLLFTCDSTKENPEGRSLLKGAYVAYKKLNLLQDQLMIGVARDLGGVPVFSVHPRYLDPNASPEDKAVADSFRQIGENLTTGAQGSVVMPLLYDPESKQPIFKMELLESKGGKAYDVPAICKQLQDDIAAAMSCSVLRLTGNSPDNYSVGTGKTNLMALHLAYRLKEISDVINNDLIPQTFALNGWNDTEFPEIVFGDFDRPAMEEFSKMLQRVASVGMVEFDRPTANLIREYIGVPIKPEDEEIDKESLTNQGNGGSKSGQGFASPSGEGTRKTPSGRDNSSDNVENSA